jgi:hypothetical protein
MSYYTVATGKLREFLEIIKKATPPTQATQKWLEGLGFTSPTHSTFLQILEQIGFLDSSRRPMELYHEFRVDKTSKIAMAKGLRKGYSLLWETYPEPHKESSDKIENVFKSKGMSEDLAKRSERTFRTLQEFADFEVLKEVPPEIKTTEAVPMAPQVTFDDLQRGLVTPRTRELAVNINIQITLPERGEPEIYDKIFAALKKHFFE